MATGGSISRPSTDAYGNSPESISNKQIANEKISDLPDISSKSPNSVSGLIQYQVPPILGRGLWLQLEVREIPKSAILTVEPL
jgi:hypothetical protein